MIRKIVEFIFSPTYFFADYRKSKYRINGKSVSKLIKIFNSSYLIVALILALFVIVIPPHEMYQSDIGEVFIYYAALLIWLYPLSRANEIFYSFYKDAIEKLNGEKPRSDLKFGERVQLALKSYIELIINFATIYVLLPRSCFDKPLLDYFDALYFSGVTITTLGYGDHSPVCLFPKLLSVYQVLCGFILIVVSFAIYAGRGMGGNNA